MSPVPRHPDLPGFHYVKGVHWMVLAGTFADRVEADKLGRVFATRPCYARRNVTHAARSLLGRGLIEPWTPGQAVLPTDLGRTYLARKHPTGHPDFLIVIAAKDIEDAKKAASDAASDQQAQDLSNDPDDWPADQRADQQMETAQ